MQNSEMVWELTIPTYKNWIYGALDPNSPGSDPVIIYTDYKNIPTDADGTLSHCRFEGSHYLGFVPDPFSTSPAGWPAWVTDLEDALDSVPFLLDGKDPAETSWRSFNRYHRATVQWQDPVLDGSTVKTPGEWQISLNVDQSAFYVLPDYEGTIIWLDEEHWYVDVIILGNYKDPADYVVISGYNAYTAVESPLKGTYYAPDNFTCPIPPDTTFRFTNRLPTDIFPIEVGDITVDEVPEGYDWPDHIQEYYPDEHGNPDPDNPVHYSGTLYPSGFTRGDYFSPPYIDVRQVKRSEIDVRKSITQ
ncbi:hypothetical protein [Gimesia chilikensis]|uniref:hypothetical protein n=1 Tax=Gimesia chilikensis TaxID=2605989 RepID=UPI003A91B180